MEYRGQVKGGVVIFEEEAPPEGASMRVAVVTSTEAPSPTIWQKRRKYSGAVKGLPAIWPVITAATSTARTSNERRLHSMVSGRIKAGL